MLQPKTRLNPKVYKYKILIFFVIIFTISESLSAQDDRLFGTGTFGGGRVFSIGKNGELPQKYVDFSDDGRVSYSDVLDSGGKAWGMTVGGGSNGFGVIFSIEYDGSGYTNVHDFDGSNGRFPYGNLIESNGKLWGITSGGGSSDNGVIFSLNTDGTQFSVVHEFDGANGGGSQGSLLESGGKLWGMTLRGGTNDVGTIFSIEFDGTGFQKIHDFGGSNGSSPYGNLIESSGKFWGQTLYGGSSDFGVLFSLDLDGSNFQVVHEFNNTEGAYPFGSLVESGSKIYGMTTGGGTSLGTIFSINTDGSAFESLHVFNGDDGIFPYGSLTLSQGKLWGVTFSGGDNGDGVIFSLDGDGTNFLKVHDFEDATGRNPRGYGGIKEINGELWGMTVAGAKSNNGVLFAIDFNGSNYQVIHEFNNEKGNQPFNSSELIQSGQKLYGMTQFGGVDGFGTIYSLDLDGTNFSKIHDFNSVEGAEPQGALISVDGKLWGMTAVGGTFGQGVIFSINPDGSGFTKVFDFDGESGAVPLESLIAVDGKLWGMTSRNGNSDLTGNGTIFSVNADGTNFTVVHVFDENGEEGSGPIGNLLLSNDKLWGVTSFGGTDDNGVIFSIEIDGSDFTVVHRFNETEGRLPLGELLESNNKLWGMTDRGGSNNSGLLFSIELNGTNFEVVHEFNSEVDGIFPSGYLVKSEGRLWGTTLGGGSEDLGIVFSIDTTGSDFQVEYEFVGTVGGKAGGSLLPVDIFAPLIADPGQLSALENTLSSIHTFEANEPVVYRLGNDKDESLFVLEAGKIRFQTEPDYENPLDSDGDNIYQLDIAATDDFGNESTLELIINVIDVDDTAPIFTSQGQITVSENVTGVVYTAETDETVTFSLGTGGDESLFTLETNLISFNTSPDFENPLDSDLNNEYLLELIATDDSNNNTSLQVTILVTDEDDDPLSLDQEFETLIYPNPTSTYFSIGVNEVEQLKISKVRVVNLNGQTIKQYVDGVKQYDINNVSSGVYLIIGDVDGERTVLGTLRVD